MHLYKGIMFSTLNIEDNNWGEFIVDDDTTNINGILTSKFKLDMGGVKDPAPNCSNREIEYKWNCGGSPIEYTGSSTYVDGSDNAIVFDCAASFKKCNLTELSLNDNGVLIMTNDNNETWRSHDEINQPIKNISDYIKSDIYVPVSEDNNNIGKNNAPGKKSTITTTSYTDLKNPNYNKLWSNNKWLSSPGGICRLIQRDGVLKLEADKKSCDLYVGEISGGDDNLDYNNIGEVGYITSGRNKRVWDKNTVQFSNSFMESPPQNLGASSKWGIFIGSNVNDIDILQGGMIPQGKVIHNANSSECQQECLAQNDCAAYQTYKDKCYILDDVMLKNKSKRNWVKYDKDINLNFRLKKMTTNESCPNDISANSIFMVSNQEWSRYCNSTTPKSVVDTSCGMYEEDGSDSSDKKCINGVEQFVSGQVIEGFEHNLQTLTNILNSADNSYNVSKTRWDSSKNTLEPKMAQLATKRKEDKIWNNEELNRLKNLTEHASLNAQSSTYKYYIWRTVAIIVLVITIILWIKNIKSG